MLDAATVALNWDVLDLRHRPELELQDPELTQQSLQKTKLDN